MKFARPRDGLRGLERNRLLALVAVSALAAMTLEDDLGVAGATPDFPVIAAIYTALSFGSFVGSIAGFGLGLFRDALFLDFFGIHALGFTLLGYGVGKLRETVYLQGPVVDLVIVSVSKVALDVLVLGAASRSAWPAFETRFFWETPIAAIYTAAIGGALYRVLRTR